MQARNNKSSCDNESRHNNGFGADRLLSEEKNTHVSQSHEILDSNAVRADGTILFFHFILFLVLRKYLKKKKRDSR